MDYVTKPIKPKEVLARMGVHLAGARERRQTRNALDAFGYATIAVRAVDGSLMWQTPLARDLLERHCATHAPETPVVVVEWLRNGGGTDISQLNGSMQMLFLKGMNRYADAIERGEPFNG